MLSLLPYTDHWQEQWDAFVQTARNGTIFHTRKFLAYHPADRFSDASLLFLDGGAIVGVLPAAFRDRKLVSHPGASYGGLVTRTKTSVAEMGGMIDLLIGYAKEKDIAGVSMLRLPPASLHVAYSEDQPYWLYQRGFILERCEMDGAINLSNMTAEDLMNVVSGKCRNMIRQAQRADITVRLSNDFASYWPILESLLSHRHGAKPTHTLAEIEKLHSLLPHHFRLLAAYKDNVMVGGIVLVTINARAIYTLYMAQEYAVQSDHPMHLLIVEAMQLVLREGKRVLHLGVSTEDGGRVINEGLFAFKESFGCKPVRRESWEMRW